MLAFHGRIEGVRFLLDHGANPDLYQRRIDFPDRRCMFYRRSIGAHAGDFPRRCWHAAVACERPLKKRPHFQDALESKGGSKHFERLDRFARKKKIKINFFTPEQTVLCWAIERLQDDSIEAALNAGADPNRISTFWDLSNGENVSCTVVSPLTLAVQMNSPKLVAMLLKYGAKADIPVTKCMCYFPCPYLMDLAVKGEVGGTALLIAVAQNSVECTELLLKAGANPNYLCESTSKKKINNH